MNTSIVLGMGFGDEGKGRTVSYLCSLYPTSLVVRFNGGSQAGHTVHYYPPKEKGYGDPVVHTFSTFGSGTLQGKPTYWSEYCALHPVKLIQEFAALDFKTPDNFKKMYINRYCPIITLYDVTRTNLENRTCTTFKRTSEGPKLIFEDLLSPKICEIKLRLIESYYPEIILDEHQKEQFNKSIEQLLELVQEGIIVPVNNLDDCGTFNHYIFEGAQGILLDKNKGFFPHVTYSNTTSLNAMKIIQKEKLNSPNIYYVSRVYQTRHGDGPMTNEDMPNIRKGQTQGRLGKFDIKLLQYAFNIEQGDHLVPTHSKNLVLTCLDQLSSDAILDAAGNYLKIKDIPELINKSFWERVLYSHGPETHSITNILEEIEDIWAR